jgi:hypothetical protein
MIRDHLKLWSIESVIDYVDFRSGHNLEAAIKSNIDSSNFFCPVFSPASVSSEWVLNLELPYAIKTGMRIIPVLVENCQIPTEFSTIRYVDFTTDWSVGQVELLRALPRGDYDEVEYLRKAFAEQRLGQTEHTLLPFLKEAAAQKRDWGRQTPIDFMQSLGKLGQGKSPLNEGGRRKVSGKDKKRTRGYLNYFYWWLNVQGVFRFKGIEPEDMAYAQDYWNDSVQCAVMTPRGVQFLNDLSLEVRTQREIKRALRKRRGGNGVSPLN